MRYADRFKTYCPFASAIWNSTTVKEKRPFHEELKAQVYWLKFTLDTLMSWNELDSLQLRFAQVDITALVKECFDALNLGAKQRDIAIVLEGAPGPVYAEADPFRLQVAIYNILENAVKFAFPRTHVHVTVHSKNRTVVVQTEDFGIAISTHDLQNVFKPYWKGASRYRGLGLGLFVSQSIVVAHRGTITIESASTPEATSQTPDASVGAYLVRVLLEIPKRQSHTNAARERRR